VLKQGDYLQQDYFDNVGGLNVTDSPFKVGDGQATGGGNYTYIQTGGIRKRQGHSKINSAANAQLKSIGLGQNNSSSGTKTLIRAAGTKLQAVDTGVPSFTNLTEDTAAAVSDFLSPSSTQTMCFSQFNTTSTNVLWMAGAGMSGIYGNYSTSKVTKNGSDAPTGSLSTSVSTPGTGTFSSTGTYYYAIALRKAATQAISNAALDISATIANTTDNVAVSLASVASIDTTKYDAIYLYRSVVSGVTAFTTGSLVSITSITAGVPASITDTGASAATAQNIPRAANLLLDNSVLDSGTYRTLTTFKRRLVTATGSTIRLSDVNKPESWPTVNTITIPSGGDITGLAIISFTSVGSNTIDEILAVFKERELWVITGDSISDFALKFIDSVGCPTQSLIVSANGYLAWLEYRGVFLWDGTGKPIYSSRPIETMFAQDGDIDKTKLSYGVGQFFRKQNQIVWFVSHKIFGEQQSAIKMDLRLTLPRVEQSMLGRILDGVFIQDDLDFPVYSALSYLPTEPEESLLIGDSSGYLYNAFIGESDGGAAISFKYATRFLDCGNPNRDKRFQYVVVWVEEVGDWNLTLDWWTDYKAADGVKSTRAQAISTISSNTTALWDVAQWDEAYWDDYTAKYKPLWFQLASDINNNSEGKCIRLQFRQEGVDQPVTIAGFSVLYSEKGIVK
jgi:hypothetical protein